MNRNSYIVLFCFAALTVLLVAFAEVETPVSKKSLPKTKVKLGEKLFFERMLSKDGSISCASCHKPEYAFSDTVKFSLGVGGTLALRNTPTIMNLAGHFPFFYDGRAANLEAQALGPIENPLEMNLPIDSALARLNRDSYYSKAFQKIYREKATVKNLSDALAAYEKSLFTNSPFDRWAQGDSTAMSPAAIRGRKLFMDKGKCFECHKGVDFTNDEFKNIGLYNGKDLNDVGRFAITKDSADLGKFKTPGLRNIAVTGPYMHNGMFSTLSEVIDYYNRPSQFVEGSIGSDTLLVPLNLSVEEKGELEAFLRSLSGPAYQKTSR
ncbi:MAG: cytochrome-c peroxidase [Bacteroidia bacterium]